MRRRQNGRNAPEDQGLRWDDSDPKQAIREYRPAKGVAEETMPARTELV